MALLEKLETALKQDGLYVEDKFKTWLEIAKTSSQSLDKLLTSSGYLTEKQMLKIFGACLDLPVYERLGDFKSPEHFVSKVPVQFARYHSVVAVGEEDGVIKVASCMPLDTHPIDDLATMLDRTIETVLAPRSEITSLINKAYQQKVDVVDEMLEDLDDAHIADLAKEVEKSQDLLDIANKAPIIKLVNMMMFQALKMRASDIHIQPYEDRLQIRYRIDGVLYDVLQPPKKVQDAIISRVKIMGKMDIAEKRLPQDGRATIKLGDGDIDVRVSTVPTAHGERVVMRLLDKSARVYELEELGLDEGSQLKAITNFINASHGIILATGPTGSGKSTSLYASLKRLNSTEYNVMTIEDPIEYHLPGVSQIEVSTKKGLTFASGLRSIVRQDPDIIMVGEIRDGETASIAIQSALTGHLVFSTLHTNDAAGAITRLLDLGVEPYLAASSLIGVVAQRLVRVICKNCIEDYTPTREKLASIGIDIDKVAKATFRRGKGCPNCFNTGFLDRTAIYEILTINDHVREQIVAHASSNLIKQDAVKAGMITLMMDGARKVMMGITTPEEVLNVTQMDSF